MLSRRSITLGLLVAIVSATAVGASSRRAPASTTVVRVSSATPGRELYFRGVLLFLGRPMRLVRQSTPFELRSDRRLVFAAFEPSATSAMLRLELVSDTPEPAVVTAPRVMVGQRIGGVATEFVQGY